MLGPAAAELAEAEAEAEAEALDVEFAQPASMALAPAAATAATEPATNERRDTFVFIVDIVPIPFLNTKLNLVKLSQLYH